MNGTEVDGQNHHRQEKTPDQRAGGPLPQALAGPLHESDLSGESARLLEETRGPRRNRESVAATAQPNQGCKDRRGLIRPSG